MVRMNDKRCYRFNPFLAWAQTRILAKASYVAERLPSMGGNAKLRVLVHTSLVAQRVFE